MRWHVPGVQGVLLYTSVGLVLTVVLQSSHASLMLTLAALATGQLDLPQGLAIAVGSNVGSTVTAVIGALGGARAGQRLAMVHVMFNLVTAVVALLLLQPLTLLVQWLTTQFGLGDNALIALALFHSLFNAIGILLFWPWQGALARAMERWLPSVAEPQVLITALTSEIQPQIRARYLGDSALASADAAARAVVLELQHLARLSLEVICHALYLPVSQLSSVRVDDVLLHGHLDGRGLDAEQLYRQYIKGVHADLLDFMSRLEVELDAAHQHFWTSAQLAALQLVDAVKDAKHLQKNLGRQLQAAPSQARQDYLDLRRYLLQGLRELRDLGLLEMPDEVWRARLEQLDAHAADFDAGFRHRLFAEVREGRLDSLQASSLMNDLGYVSRIIQSLRNLLLLTQGEEGELFRPLRQLAGDEAPLIQLD